MLAEVDGLASVAELVDGAWPTAPAGAAAEPGGGVVDVALPEPAAAGLGVAVGDRLSLVDLVDSQAPNQAVRVSGIFTVADPSAPVWADLPLAVSGVERSDFTSYGPFVLATGTLDGPLVGSSGATWRAVPPLAGLTTEDLPGAQRRAAQTARTLATLDLRSIRVRAPLPDLLAHAVLVAQRIGVALLVPSVLLTVLGTVSLVVAAALLASLRAAETRLLRTRGASTAQLAGLALGESTFVTLLGLAGTVLVAPAVARAVAGSFVAGAGGAPAGRVWTTAVPLAVLAVVVSVSTSVWVGRTPGTGSGGTRGRMLRVAVGSGVDVVLVVLAALAAVQLRRYDAAAATGVDPLTTAAPVLVIAGLAVLSLRLIPVLARGVAGLAVPRRGLDLAWGSWQFARRASGQAGTLLLVLLAVGVGTVALGHSATAERAVTDQSAFDSGAPLRVVRADAAADPTAMTALTRSASGGAGRVMPAWRSSIAIGDLEDVTVLAADTATAGRVMDPRPDTVHGGSWTDLVGRLARARDLGGGAALPDGTRHLTVEARLRSEATSGRLSFPATLHVRDARGLVTTVPLGLVSPEETTLTADLAGAGLTGRLTLVGVFVPIPEWVHFFTATPVDGIDVGRVEADGTPVEHSTFREHRVSPGLWYAPPPGRLAAVPAIVTRQVADAVRAAGGGPVVLQLGTVDVPVTVAGVLDVLPTAARPTRGVLVDLPTLGALAQQGVRPWAVVAPGEWWADPVHVAAAAAAVRAGAPHGTTVLVRADVEAGRLTNPVNAGMRAAMALVTVASVLLAAVGFAATTAALGRARRHENAVLLALGMPPRRIRTVLVLERVLVTVVTVLVGVALGVLAALTVVPLLVGGDGHPQVPPVLVQVPALPLLVLAAVVTGVLSLVGVLVLRSTSRDLSGELREGDAP